MTLVTLIVACMILLCAGTVEIAQRNISCSDIKSAQGFKFLHECPNGAIISAFFEKTRIAALTNGKPECMPDLVKGIDSSSITTVDCRDLTVKCFTYVTHVIEKWVNFTVTETHEPDSPTPYGLWIGVGAGVAVIIILVGCCCRYRCWRNDMMRQDRTATVRGFLSDLLTACCRTRMSCAETAELGSVATAASDPQGSGENGPVQNGTAVVHSGETNGHVNGAMRRVKKDDPGGHNGVMVTHARSGCVRGDRGGGEDHEAESFLLLNERANIRDPDMAGEAEALVKKSGFDPGQVSSCFAAPNSDVESTSQDEETQ